MQIGCPKCVFIIRGCLIKGGRDYLSGGTLDASGTRAKGSFVQLPRLLCLSRDARCRGWSPGSRTPKAKRRPFCPALRSLPCSFPRGFPCSPAGGEERGARRKQRGLAAVARGRGAAIAAVPALFLAPAGGRWRSPRITRRSSAWCFVSAEPSGGRIRSRGSNGWAGTGPALRGSTVRRLRVDGRRMKVWGQIAEDACCSAGPLPSSARGVIGRVRRPGSQSARRLRWPVSCFGGLQPCPRPGRLPRASPLSFFISLSALSSLFSRCRCGGAGRADQAMHIWESYSRASPNRHPAWPEFLRLELEVGGSSGSRARLPLHGEEVEAAMFRGTGR